jgi:hypothetical protein
MPFALNQSARLSSVVVPVWMQTVAPSSSSAEVTPRSLETMKPWPS